MKFLILFVLLGILLFAGSASAAVDFPADEAGISAYVNAKSSINLNDAKPAFASIWTGIQRMSPEEGRYKIQNKRG